METMIKLKIEASLIKEINYLDASNFEIVGNYMIEAIEGIQLIHKGLNKYNRPSGYTVDSYSQDSSIICQYSVEKNYFNDNKKYTKIKNDIEKALGHIDHEKIEKIYLLSSQEALPSFRKEFNKI